MQPPRPASVWATGLVALCAFAWHANGALAQPAWGSGTTDEAPAPESDTWLDDSRMLVAVAWLSGKAPSSDFDGALFASGFNDSRLVTGGNALVLWRALPHLWFGARLGARTRDWSREDGPYASAFGVGALGIAQVQLLLAERTDAAVSVGLGGAIVGVMVNDIMEAHFAPRLHASLSVGVTVYEPIRLFIRGGWDYMLAANVNELGHDVDLGGFSASAGVEVRP